MKLESIFHKDNLLGSRFMVERLYTLKLIQTNVSSGPLAVIQNIPIRLYRTCYGTEKLSFLYWSIFSKNVNLRILKYNYFAENQYTFKSEVIILNRNKWDGDMLFF
jgi:hypothetical protein